MGEALERIYRAALVFTLVAWLPLLLLSALERHAPGSDFRLSFLRDIEANVRLLVALPVPDLNQCTAPP